MLELIANNLVNIIRAITVAAGVALGWIILNAVFGSTEINDLETMAQAMQLAYQGQSYQYGTAVIPSTVLISTGKVDSSIITNGNTINTRWQTPIVWNGATNNFTATLSSVKYNDCTSIVEDSGLANYVQTYAVGSNTAAPGPFDPPTATSQCGTSGTTTVTITLTGHP